MSFRAFIKDNYLIGLLFVTLFAAVILRPLLPVDETRYLSAAWEMWFTKNWFHMTVNFQPYSHKPPFLFWLINLSWAIFGVSRLAAALPIILSSVIVVILTGKLARVLFPDDEDMAARARLTLMGSAPFLIYASLIMFDVTICLFSLAALLCLLSYATRRSIMTLLGYGLFMGLGVITKGPVVYLYTLLPALLAPLWMPKEEKPKWPLWYGACLMAVIFSALPALFWLSEGLKSEGPDFIYWLLWKQTAGRVTGGFNDIHPRPFYFYTLMAPLFLLPWVFFPSLWRGLHGNFHDFKTMPALRFLACWIVAAFIAFSLIAGKQPHYLAPLLPGIAIALAWFMRPISMQALRISILCAFIIFTGAHIAAKDTLLPAYDLQPIAAFVAEHQDKPWAYAGNYNGEIGFIARMREPIDPIDSKDISKWFSKHRNGYAIVRYRRPEQVKNYEVLVSKAYRGGHTIAVVKSKGRASEIFAPSVTQKEPDDREPENRDQDEYNN